MAVLEVHDREEREDGMRVDLETIRILSLDKLLEDMVNKDNRPYPMPFQLRADVCMAASLQRLWRERFRADYFDIEKKRYHDLTGKGPLKGVVYDENETGPGRWKTRTVQQLSGLEGTLQFEPGR